MSNESATFRVDDNVIVCLCGNFQMRPRISVKRLVRPLVGLIVILSPIGVLKKLPFVRLTRRSVSPFVRRSVRRSVLHEDASSAVRSVGTTGEAEKAKEKAKPSCCQRRQQAKADS